MYQSYNAYGQQGDMPYRVNEIKETMQVIAITHGPILKEMCLEMFTMGIMQIYDITTSCRVRDAPIMKGLLFYQGFSDAPFLTKINFNPSMG